MTLTTLNIGGRGHLLTIASGLTRMSKTRPATMTTQTTLVDSRDLTRAVLETLISPSSVPTLAEVRRVLRASKVPRAKNP
jgi:hypothetical protein